MGLQAGSLSAVSILQPGSTRLGVPCKHRVACLELSSTTIMFLPGTQGIGLGHVR